MQFALRARTVNGVGVYVRGAAPIKSVVAIVVFFFGVFSGVVDRVRLVLCPKENFKLILFVVFINKY